MDVRVYSGKYRKQCTSEESSPAKIIYNTAPQIPPKKAVAFDLDETLGHFSELCALWSRIPMKDQNQPTFNRLLDLYPEFPRVGILGVLRFLRTKIAQGECHPIYIYTNNQCKMENWVYRIMSYFEFKTGIQFTRPICAYKVENKRMEMGRTTHEKTYTDFVQCSMLQSPFELCFVDDRNHSSMRRSKVYYIQPPPYFHSLSKDEIEYRFDASEFGNRILPFRRFQQIVNPNTMNQQSITNKIRYYLREFFLMSLLRRGRCRTKKRRRGFGTRKK